MISNDYYIEDFNDPDREVIRPKEIKKSAAFSYCKWAAEDWEAKFYAWTPTHLDECARHIDQMLNNPAWYKWRSKKVDKRAVTRNNQAKDKGRGRVRNSKR